MKRSLLALVILGVVSVSLAAFGQQSETRYFVIGHIKNPGAYQLPADMMVEQALAVAGGISERGDITRIHLIRMVNRQRVEFVASLSDVVRPNDTLHVGMRQEAAP